MLITCPVAKAGYNCLVCGALALRPEPVTDEQLLLVLREWAGG